MQERVLDPPGMSAPNKHRMIFAFRKTKDLLRVTVMLILMKEEWDT